MHIHTYAAFSIHISIYLYIHIHVYVSVCVCEGYYVHAFSCSFSTHCLSLFTFHHSTDRSLCMKTLASDDALTVVRVLVLRVCTLPFTSPLHVLVLPAFSMPASTISYRCSLTYLSSNFPSLLRVYTHFIFFLTLPAPHGQVDI